MTSVQLDNQVFLPKDSDLPFPHVLLVEASAGSGKTFQLACRFVQYLISQHIPHSHISQIAALTFTNEAASEMQGRIMQFLKETAFDTGLSAQLIKGIVDTDSAALQKAALSSVDDLIQLFDSWNIRTIDSFLYRIVQGAAPELGLSPMDEIMPFDHLPKEAALDRLLVKAAYDQNLKGKLVKSIKHAIEMHEAGSWWPRQTLSELIREYDAKENIYGRSFQKSVAWQQVNSAKKDFQKSVAAFLKEVEVLGLKLKKHAQNALEKVVKGDISKAITLKAFEYEDPATLFLSSKKLENLPGNLCKIWSQVRTDLTIFCEKQTLHAGSIYLDLLHIWRKELAHWKQDRQALFFSDINHYANRVVHELGTPEIVLRLGEKMYHFFIDEFQDTSLVQWDAMAPLIENALAQGGSLFCVGDRKQLLYRWRGSEEKVFLEKPRSFPSVDQESIIEIQLPYNRRSSETILSFVRFLFSEKNFSQWLATKGEKASDFLKPDFLAQAYSGANQKTPDNGEDESRPGYVCVELMDPPLSKKEDMLNAAQKWCIDLLKDDVLHRYKPGNVMVLCRQNSDVEIFSTALHEASIPVISDRQMSVKADPVVKEIYSLLALVSNPQDNLALVQLLSGKISQNLWMRISDMSGWHLVETICFDQSSSHQMENGAYNSSALERKYPYIWRMVLKPFIDQCGKLTPYETASLFIRQFDIKKRFPAHWPMVKHFLDLLHGDAIGRPIDWPELDFWNDLPDEIFQILPAQTNSVRVMTVHKAKGLEADVVILPFAALAADSKGPLKSTLLEINKSALNLYKANKHHRKYSPKLTMLYAEEMRQRWLDELNVLYVAVTRPRHELYMFIPQGIKRKNSLVNLVRPLLKDGVKYSLGSKGEPEQVSLPSQLITQTAATADFSLPDNPPQWKWPRYLVRKEWISPLSGDFKRAKKAADIGLEIHALLAKITGFLSVPQAPSEVEAFLKTLYKDGASKRMSKDQIEQVLEKLSEVSKTICHPLAKALFWQDLPGIVWTEMEIADKEGNLFRADRVVKSEDNILVGEFKTGEVDEQKDREQIERYLMLLRQLYPHCNAKGLLLYLDKGIVFEVCCSA